MAMQRPCIVRKKEKKQRFHAHTVCVTLCDIVPLQELQEQRMAAIGNPAHKRETLGDKVRAGVLVVPRQLWGVVSTFASVNEIIGQPFKL
jgi:hypothetical protein